MTSLGMEIGKLSNPTPQFLDPDDDDYPDPTTTETTSENEHKNLFQSSKLRSRTAPLLEDVDQSYIGRKVSRKSRGLVFDKEESEPEINDMDSDTENDEEEDDLKTEDASSLKSNSELEGSEDENSEEETEKDDITSQFSNINMNNEVEKGNAIKAQQEIWNKLCECRIKLQKLLIIANKLPQADSWNVITNEAGEEVNESISKGSDSVKLLLDSLIKLKQEVSQVTEEEKESVDEMEIPSSSEDEHDVEDSKEDNTSITSGAKRKHNNENYDEILSKHFKSEKTYRNSVIQKWDEKVRLSTGRMTQKSFNVFGNSAVKQIEQILQDKTRLIKRTQLKRSVYRVLGKPEFSDLKSNESTNLESETTSKQDLLLKDYDPEIFDDDDFYRQLLKDIIQSKSMGMDPSIVRKQMEFQKMRNKMKRKVDTKASKGRKLRYDVHPKLVNCMAPVQAFSVSDEARETIMKCFFGKSSAQS